MFLNVIHAINTDMEGLPKLIILLFTIVIVIPGVLIYYNERKSKKDFNRKIGEVGECFFKDGKLGKEITLTAITGLVLKYRVYTFKNRVCPFHAKEQYNKYQHHNLTKGWWSLTGIIRAPSHLIDNLNEYQKYLKLVKNYRHSA